MSTPPWDTPSSLLLIKSPFLLSRFVIFCQYLYRDRRASVNLSFVLALQIYLNLSALVFAIWNVGASRAAGVHGGFLNLNLLSCFFDGVGSWRRICVHNLQ